MRPSPRVLLGLAFLLSAPLAASAAGGKTELLGVDAEKKEISTSIRQITMEDLGSFGPSLRYSITVDRALKISRTDRGSNVAPVPPSTVKGEAPLQESVLLFSWFQTELSKLSSISANERICDGGCRRLTVERDDGATLVWSFSDFDAPMALWVASQLVDALAGHTKLSPCGD